MTEAQLNSHIKVLAILHIIFAGMSLIGAWAIVLSTVAVGVLPSIISGEHLPLAIVGTIGTLIAGFMILTHLPGLIGAFGLLKQRSWARIVLMVVSFFYLIAFPLGTALGVYTLWVLWQPECQQQMA